MVHPINLTRQDLLFFSVPVLQEGPYLAEAAMRHETFSLALPLGTPDNCASAWL
jgi:hypothetical protein